MTDRINTATADQNLFGPGKHGFTEGPPNATRYSAEWSNGMQEAIVRTIEAAGLVPDALDLDQFTNAIVNSSFAGGVQTITSTGALISETGATVLFESGLQAGTGTGASLTTGVEPYAFVAGSTISIARDGGGADVVDFDPLNPGGPVTNAAELEARLSSSLTKPIKVTDNGTDVTLLTYKVGIDAELEVTAATGNALAVLGLGLGSVFGSAGNLLEVDPVAALIRVTGLGLESDSGATFGGLVTASEGLDVDVTGATPAIDAAGDTGPGIVATTSAVAQPALLATGSASAGSAGVLGLAGSTGAAGVQGQALAGGLVTGAGVRAVGQGDAPAFSGSSDDGYGLSISSGGERAQIRMNPNSGQPATNFQGDLAYDSGTALNGQLLIRHVAGFQAAHSSPKGQARGIGSMAGSGTTAGGPVVIDSAIITPEVVGDTVIEISFGVDFDADGSSATIQLYDQTAAVIVATQPVVARYINSLALTGRNAAHVFKTKYTLPDAATRTLEARLVAISGTVMWDNAGIEVLGVF